MALLLTPGLGKGQYRISGTMENVDTDFTVVAASERVPLPDNLRFFRWGRIHMVQTSGTAAAIAPYILNRSNIGGGDPPVGVRVQARLDPLSGDPTVADQWLARATAQCVDNGAIWIFPGPDADNDNDYDIDISLFAGWD